MLLPLSLSCGCRRAPARARTACKDGEVTLAMDADGYATSKTEYYAKLEQWLSGRGARYASDIIWVNKAAPEQGIQASRSLSCVLVC